MKWHEFIFSNRIKHRILRHATFWFAFWLFYLCTYFIPVACFPAWKIQGAHLSVLNQLGVFKFSLMCLLFSSRYMTWQLVFTYTLIYYLMPRYLIKEKYIAFGVGIVLLLFATIVSNSYINSTTQSSVYQIFDVAFKVPARDALFRRAIDGGFYNFPTIGAIALGIKLLKHWWLKQQEEQQLIISKTNVELQLLKAQVHPHFLFNTINNIYSFILISSPKAPEMIKKLSGLLHYIIHECNQSQVPMEKELKMLRDYISLETIRYGEQFDITVDIRGDYSNKNIAPLLLLPFVENSFKHGTSKMLSKPWVNLNIIIEDTKMYFMLNNSKPQEYINPNRNGGIGLGNVQKRLQLLYPGKHELKMTSEPEHFTVLMEIELLSANEKPILKNIKKEKQQYEMA
jgi:sensor histidine kinase YesM